MISLIAAVAKNGVIGKNNLMPWHISQETKLFRSLTDGKPVIVGRRTFESLPNLLENRYLIVLSRNKELVSGSSAVQIAHSMEEAIQIAMQYRKEIMVAGGESIYQQFLPLADALYLSMLPDSYEGDAFFPSIKYSQWKPRATTRYNEFSFVTFKRTHSHATA